MHGSRGLTSRCCRAPNPVPIPWYGSLSLKVLPEERELSFQTGEKQVLTIQLGDLEASVVQLRIRRGLVTGHFHVHVRCSAVCDSAFLPCFGEGNLKIRSKDEPEAVPLDDVIGACLNWFYASRARGLSRKTYPVCISSVCECDFSEFFENYVSALAGGSSKHCRIRPSSPAGIPGSLAGLELVRGEKTAADFGFEATSNHGEPPIIARIDEGSPAAAAGLQLGDVILSQYRGTEAGEELSLKVLRDGEERELSFQTGEKQVLTIQLGDLEDPSVVQLRIRRGLVEGDKDR